MKVCSVCLKCYDDSDAICPVDEGHGSLAEIRQGNRLIVEGYRIDACSESPSPVELYKATQLATEKSVLIQFVESGDLCPEVEALLQAAANRDHPSLVHIPEFGRVSETELFVVLGDTAGQSLYEYLAEFSPLPEKPAIRIIRQLAEGLEVLHADGLVHGGLNPGSIVVETEGENVHAKLTQFDFAGKGAVAADARRYFSPEQLAGAEADFRSDLYSLALVFYEMLIGSLPYDTDDPDAVSGFVFDKLDVWHLHVELRALIAHSLGESLRKRLELRPKSTNIFVRQIRHLEQVANRIDDDGRDSNKENVPAATPVSTAPVSEVREPHVPVSPTVSKAKSDPPIFLGSIDIEGTVETGIREPGEDPGDEHVSDFVEVPIGPGMLAEPYSSESETPAPRGNRSRAVLYVAGLLVSAVIGGVFTSSVFDSRNAAATADRAKPPEEVSKPRRTKVPEKSQVVALVNGPAADAADSDDAFERARELDRVVDEGSEKRIVPKRSASKSAKQRPARKSRRRVKRKSKRKKRNPAAKKPKLQTRPRYVKDVIIYY